MRAFLHLRLLPKLFLLRLLFGRLRSRVVGEVLSTPLPPPLMQLGVRLLDALNPKALGEIRYPVESYRTLGDLFSRTLKDGSREIKDLSPSAIVRNACMHSISLRGCGESQW